MTYVPKSMRKSKKNRVVFVVSIERLTPDGQAFEMVKERLLVRDPVNWDYEDIRRAVREQYPKLWRTELLGRRWNVNVLEWK